jgi:hypothetical protein
MTTDELLALLTERGLSVVLSATERLSLRGDKRNVDAALMGVLPFHREELLKRRRATAPVPVEYLFLWGLAVRYPPHWRAPPGAVERRAVDTDEWLPLEKETPHVACECACPF